MEKIKELYEKVAGDSALQAKFAEIMNGAKAAGEAATGERLVAFAKEEGYEVSLEEMQDFFRKLAEKKEGELSNVELDMVAGGKGLPGILSIAASVGTLGFACALASAATADPSTTEISFYRLQDCSN